MLLAVMLVAGPVLSVCANAQTFFYTEVAKDGRLYVFAVASRHDAFVKSGGVDTGPVITRPGYGTNGETVVFDSEDAVNLYRLQARAAERVLPRARGILEVPVPCREDQRSHVRGLLLVLPVASG